MFFCDGRVVATAECGSGAVLAVSIFQRLGAPLGWDIKGTFFDESLCARAGNVMSVRNQTSIQIALSRICSRITIDLGCAASVSSSARGRRSISTAEPNPKPNQHALHLQKMVRRAPDDAHSRLSVRPRTLSVSVSWI